MNFSIMLPTRKKPGHLRLCLESILMMTKDMSNVEILLAGDDDDESPKIIFEEIKIKFPSLTKNLFLHIRPRGNNLIEHYENWLANFCRGKFILMMNDDAMFISQNWDEKANERLEEYLKDKPDRLVCGIIEDLDDPLKEREKLGFLVSDFPLLSRESVDALGFFLDPCFYNATADASICYLYHQINRVLDLRDIWIIQHKSPKMKGLDGDRIRINDRYAKIYSEIPRYLGATYDTYLGRNIARLQYYMKKVKKEIEINPNIKDKILSDLMNEIIRLEELDKIRAI